QFFKIANQHMRWELNDLCRRLDNRTQAAELGSQVAALPESSASPLTPVARRIFDTIDGLPEVEREAFELVRIQGMSFGGGGSAARRDDPDHAASRNPRCPPPPPQTRRPAARARAPARDLTAGRPAGAGP